ncbi:MAG: hypothetical protein ABIH92_03190, partial [Nanoarchaeota archaeon]
VPSYFVNHFQVFLESDLLVKDVSDEERMEHYLGYHHISKPMPELEDCFGGLWSGYRSALVRDPETKELYRLKGVALNPKEPEPMITTHNGEVEVRIWGGQKRINAIYEARMIKRFNRTLESEGIEPIVEPVGMWKYSALCKGHRPTASIFRVKGDTRLDELIHVIEGLAILKCDVLSKSYREDKVWAWSLGNYTPEGKRFSNCVRSLSSDIGFVVGRLKKLMDVSGQTWGINDYASNSHWGNIVLYRDGTNLKVNLVDFDMSYGSDECTKSELQDMQKKEAYELITSFNENAISPREMEGKPFSHVHYPIKFEELRHQLARGFAEGYSSNGKNYSFYLDVGKLDEIFNLLREDTKFSVNPNKLKKHIRNKCLSLG